MTEKEYKERVELEAKSYYAMVDYVKNNMKDSTKDSLYKIFIGVDNWTFKKETLSYKEYAKYRDEMVAAQLAGEYLAEDIGEPLTPELIKKYTDPVFNWNMGNQFTKNAVKAMQNFPNQLAAILSETGEGELDPKKMVYLGGKTYRYANMFIISFRNSPAEVEVRYMA